LPSCPEVYAAREKNGVYIPKERFYQEESERKVLLPHFTD
jgi:kinesin family protein 11